MARLPVIHHNDDTEETLPHKWEICGHCRGEGKSSAHLGAFSAEQMNEEGPEFIEDYCSGFYDKTCDHCGGSGKVAVADTSRMTKKQRKAWRHEQAVEAELAADERSERFMDPDYINELRGF
jgi:hypothetical protein